MSESNFVDYVKIYCRSGKEDVDHPISVARNMCKEDLTEVTVVREGRVCVVIETIGPCTYVMNVILWLGMVKVDKKFFGQMGQSRVIEVPCGTVVYDALTGEYIYDIFNHEEKHIVKGARWLSATHFKHLLIRLLICQPGEPFEERWIILELNY